MSAFRWGLVPASAKAGGAIISVALLSFVCGLAVGTHPFWPSPADGAADIRQLSADPPKGTSEADGHAFPYCDQVDTVMRYTCLIEQSGLGASVFLRSGDKKSDEDIKATEDVFKVLAALDLVSTIVSSSRYSFLKQEAGQQFEKPGSNAGLCLDRGYGICGNHYAVFENFLTKLEIPVRYVRMYFINKDTGNKNSHIAAEVNINGTWRYIDTSKGAVWLNDQDDLLSLMSFEDVMLGHGHRLHNEILPWTIAKHFSDIDNFPYLQAEHLDYLAGDMDGVIGIYFEDLDGDLYVEPKVAGPSYSTDLRGVPSYVSLKKGKIEDLDHRLQYRLVLPPSSYSATFAIASISGCDDAHLSIGGKVFDLKAVNGSLSADVTGGDIVKVVGNSERCRVTFSSIEVARSMAKPVKPT